MKRINACALAAMLSACANAPQPKAIPAECGQLDAQIASTEDARRTALDKQHDAWKAVVPFAVAARHASGKSAAAEAEQRLAELRAASARQGCHA
jgi:hypothetical protein